MNWNIIDFPSVGALRIDFPRLKQMKGVVCYRVCGKVMIMQSEDQDEKSLFVSFVETVTYRINNPTERVASRPHVNSLKVSKNGISGKLRVEIRCFSCKEGLSIDSSFKDVIRDVFSQ